MSVIVLTGATKGLGRALIPHFVEAGHTVVACGRNQEQIEKLQHAFPKHSFSVVDVRDARAVSDWGKNTISRFGPPQWLINNAAVVNRPARLWEFSDIEIDELIDINIKGVINVVRAFVPEMVNNQSGVIVNLSSGWGRSTSPEVAPYCASKYAIEGLTLALADELPSNMAAVPLNPGIIDTQMLRKCWGEGASSYMQPVEWAKIAAPFILKLNPKHNGRSLTVS
jgi:NADP-dependent 3-hydroxy acid dehydrogenase YdfG